MENQKNQHGRDQADGKYDKSVPHQLNSEDSDLAQKQVRENEDASLQDDTYAFDEDNTGNEDYHDASDVGDDSDDFLH